MPLTARSYFIAWFYFLLFSQEFDIEHLDIFSMEISASQV
jgi:hypothetical protein